jgi:hypothetical protein
MPLRPVDRHRQKHRKTDRAQKRSGPLWVRGGIPVIAADGQAYEVRIRMTLCRCGKSENKPFCNGAPAADPKFRDGLA